MRPWIVFSILLASLVCQLVGLAMFAKGFFPYKPISTTFASLDHLPPLPQHPQANDLQGSGQSLDQDLDQGMVQPRFGKVVLMLVDALRSDFLFGNESDFTYMQSLIETHRAIPFTALASAPTVTLPRLKALTTGTVPGFLDAILNIAESDQSSTLASQDNWIAQLTRSPSHRPNAAVVDIGSMRKSNKTIGFFGDDTWIKLFPGQFFRVDGTSSFFAMDTVEVDNNVTRHVASELNKDDWDGLIFHYLGLDHVGHSGGPKSLLMRPKQAEMDGVAKLIYETLLEKDASSELPTLFILCGDHGMNEVGNHGGSSRSEISTSFLFMSSAFQSSTDTIKRMVDPLRPRQQGKAKEDNVQEQEEYQYYKAVNQVDLVPTLSLLMGLPIPINNVGKIIPELFEDYSNMERLRVLQLNAHQVAKVLKKMSPGFETESLELLDTQANIADQDLKVSSERCSDRKVLKTEMARLECWYTLGLVEHASVLDLYQRLPRDKRDSMKEVQLGVQAAEQGYSNFLHDSSSMLSTALSKYDMALLTNGSMMMAFAVAGMILCIMQTNLVQDFKQSCRRHQRLSVASSAISLSSLAFSPASLVAIPTATLQTIQKSIRKRSRGKVSDVDWKVARLVSVLILVLYWITLFASSFVEEEHQFWYFFGMTWWAVLGLVSAKELVSLPTSSSSSSSSKSSWSAGLAGFKAPGFCLGQMAVLRLLRAWNQTGQKYADQIDLRHYFNSTWLGTSWILFFMTMIVVAGSMITLMFTVGRSPSLSPSMVSPSSAQSATTALNPRAVTAAVQGLLVVQIVVVTCWITVYKMDLESVYFGGEEGIMKWVHAAMSTVSSVGYSSSLSADSMGKTMVVSGYEMARGCYAGLAGILVLVGVLKTLVLQSSPSVPFTTSAASAGVRIRQDKARTLFVPGMVLGGFTLLLILLSRRHNAPLFVLFGIQVWMYLEWISLLWERNYHPLEASITPNVPSITLVGQVNGIATNATASVDTETRSLTLRSLPGQNSIHSCTILISTLGSFFILGNSNSIASIDISQAYVGIQAYDLVLTGVLTFVSNWSGPIWWTVAGVVMMRWDMAFEMEARREVEGVRELVEEEMQWRGRKTSTAMKEIVDEGSVEKAEVTEQKEIEAEEVQDHGWRRAEKGTRTRRTLRRLAREREQKLRMEKSRKETESQQAQEAKEEEEAMESERRKLEEEEDQVHAQDAQEEFFEEQEYHDQEQPHEPGYADLDGDDTVQKDSQPLCFTSTSLLLNLTQSRILEHALIMSMFFGLALYVLSIAAIVLRHHLFIWTVFSPKVLYQLAWSVLFQGVVQVLGVGVCLWGFVLVLEG